MNKFLLCRWILTKRLSEKTFVLSDLFGDLANEIDGLKGVYLRKLVEEFVHGYQDSQKFKNISERIMRRCVAGLDEMSRGSQVELIRNLAKGIEKKVEYKKELILKILECLMTPKELFMSKSELGVLFQFLHLANEKEIDYSYITKSYFSRLDREVIEQASVDSLVGITDILTKIGEKNKYFNVFYSSASIYDVLEAITHRRMEEFSIPEKYLILKCFITNDRGSEDFIRGLEANVFKNISCIDSQSLISIPLLYKYRKIHNSQYMINTYSIPLYNSLLSRFETFSPRLVSLFLFNYWSNSTHYGLYCDHLLRGKLLKLLTDTQYFRELKPEVRNYLLTNLISYLSHARQLDEEIAEAVIRISEEFFDSFDRTFLLRVLTYITREKHFPVQFITRSLTQIFQDLNFENHSQLYSIFLNLKFRNSDVFKKTSHFFNPNLLSKIESDWKKKRKLDIASSAGSHSHRSLEKLLEQKEIEYQSEYYDEFYLDVAIPSLKICIELTGPGHYLFPSLLLNGRTHNKQEILVQKGWKVYQLPYFQPKSLENFLSSILPLHY